MEKSVLVGFIFLILLSNMVGVSASLSQLTTDYARIKIDSDSTYCWECIDNYPLVTQSLNAICPQGSSNLKSTPEIETMISKSDSFAALSNDLYKKKMIGCHMSYFRDHLEDAIITDPNENGLLDREDTVEGIVSKDVKWNFTGKVATIYKGTRISYQNSVWIIEPGKTMSTEGPSTKNYFEFDNKKFIATDLDSRFIVSRIFNTWNANPDTPTPRTNIMAMITDLFRRFSGLFA